MGEFFKVVKYQEARQMVIEHFPMRESEKLSLIDGLNRILVEDIKCLEDIPAFHRSTVDGYAVHAQDTFGSSESLQAFLDYAGRVNIGEDSDLILGPGQCCWIPTGGMLPAGTDAVVMIEYTEKLGEDTILVSKPVSPGENVMLRGEDISQGSLLFPIGRKIRAQEIGMLASVGIDEIEVLKPYVVGIISTGDEVIPIHKKPLAGQVRDVNSYTLAAAAASCGAIPHRYPIVKDDFQSLKNTIDQALQENDLLLLSGGSSVGVADYSLEVLQSFPDSELLFHGIAVKPGKPAMAIRIGQKLVVGLPGHPVSALMVFLVICAPALGHEGIREVEAELVENLASQAGRDDFIPVHLEDGEQGKLAYPLLGKSGLMSILARADGYVHIAYEKQGLLAADRVTVTLF